MTTTSPHRLPLPGSWHRLGPRRASARRRHGVGRPRGFFRHHRPYHRRRCISWRTARARRNAPHVPTMQRAHNLRPLDPQSKFRRVPVCIGVPFRSSRPCVHIGAHLWTGSNWGQNWGQTWFEKVFAGNLLLKHRALVSRLGTLETEATTIITTPHSPSQFCDIWRQTAEVPARQTPGAAVRVRSRRYPVR
jgi:hypothetical protein